MKLQTFVPRPRQLEKLDYHSKAVFLGSCFSSNMAKKLEYFKFDASSNPFGTIYQPEAIFKLLNYAMGISDLSMEETSSRDSYVFHDDVHSEIFANDSQALEKLLKDKISCLKSDLEKADVIFLTFGSSFSYRKIETNSLVANCHKQASSLFIKEMRSFDDMMASAKPCLELLKDKKIIVTVSPIRHLRDGLLDNQLSKSNLRLFCNKLESSFENISYYPSYEIFMDELRDYRFYEEDMIHPNNISINYIWEYFVEDFIKEDTKTEMKQFEKLRKSLDHRPLKSNDPSYLKHLESLKTKLEAFKSLDLSLEISEVEQRIQRLK